MKLTVQLRNTIHWFNYNYRDICFYCGVITNKRSCKDSLPFKPNDQTIDHVIPLSKGGKDNKVNRVIACWSCNHTKRDSEIFTFRRLRFQNRPFFAEIMYYEYRHDKQQGGCI